jgi:hypothetical protein
MDNDEVLVCKECGGEFVFTSNEQEFYSQKNLSKPKKCKSCRDIRKIEIERGRGHARGRGGRGRGRGRGRDRGDGCWTKPGGDLLHDVEVLPNEKIDSV